MAQPPKPVQPVPPIPFPLARTTPPHTPSGYKELGTTELARTLGVADDALFGHWCRRCEGLWWGMPLEAQCPVCGKRGA